jgi:hypothetical protein
MTIAQTTTQILLATTVVQFADVGDRELQLQCLSLCGAAIGGYAIGRGWEETAKKLTLGRFLVHTGSGFAFGLPFTAWACGMLSTPVTSYAVIAGGFLMGCFGVGFLSIIPGVVSRWLEKRGLIPPSKVDNEKQAD